MIKIEKIIKINNPYKPKDKPWTMYTAFAEVSGEYSGNCKLITFSKTLADNRFKVNETFEKFDQQQSKPFTDNNTGEERTITEIRLKNENTGSFKGRGFQKASYTTEEFLQVFKSAVGFAKLQKEISKDVVFERFVNNALMYGIKFEDTKPKAVNANKEMDKYGGEDDDWDDLVNTVNENKPDDAAGEVPF